MSQSLQKPTLLALISSCQNVTSEFGVRVCDKSAVVMSLKLSFPCPLDKKLRAFVFFKCFSKCVMAAALVPGMASSSSARKARQESVVPIGIDAECDASLLANDNTFYGDDKYDAGAAAAEWSDSDTEEDSLSTSVLCHRIDLTLATLRLRRLETKRSAT